jgi:tellurite methyltransferase
MEKENSIAGLLGDTDIYLVDQLMKNRYAPQHKILDAGCGRGRNLHWFVKNNRDITGIDNNEACIAELKAMYPALASHHLFVSAVEKMPFPDNRFDHIISSAVLHFATGTAHFNAMMAEMIRVVKPGGSLFIRMTSDIGIESKILPIADGVYWIPDGSQRFLLTRSLITKCMETFPLSFLEPLKTVNVNDMRCMSTLVLQKNN